MINYNGDIMETEDIKYCVECMYNGPASDYYPSKSKRFFKKMDDVSEFLVKIRDNKGDLKWYYDPIVYESRFIKMSSCSVDGMIESYEKRKKGMNIYKKLEKEAALEKLTERERKLLGL
jgi:hypothetical protein